MAKLLFVLFAIFSLELAEFPCDALAKYSQRNSDKYGSYDDTLPNSNNGEKKSLISNFKARNQADFKPTFPINSKLDSPILGDQYMPPILNKFASPFPHNYAGRRFPMPFKHYRNYLKSLSRRQSRLIVPMFMEQIIIIRRIPVLLTKLLHVKPKPDYPPAPKPVFEKNPNKIDSENNDEELQFQGKPDKSSEEMEVEKFPPVDKNELEPVRYSNKQTDKPEGEVEDNIEDKDSVDENKSEEGKKVEEPLEQDQSQASVPKPEFKNEQESNEIALQDESSKY